jgi:5-methylcytosine-specific restriction endonuclease McrA
MGGNLCIVNGAGMSRRRSKRRQDIVRHGVPPGECSYCGEKCKTTFDHFHPFSRGGTDLVYACERCNFLKEDLTPDQWLEKIQKIQVFDNEKTETVVRNLTRLIIEIPCTPATIESSYSIGEVFKLSGIDK